MPVTLAAGEAELDLELRLSATATVADVSEALAGGGVAPGTVLLVDGRDLDPDLPAGEAGLRPGSVVELAPAAHRASPEPHERPVAELRVVGGLAAGAIHPLTPGRWVVGRSPAADVRLASDTVSAEHCAVEVDALGSVVVTDLGSRNGTRLDGRFVTAPTPVLAGSVLGLGATEVVVGPAGDHWPRPPARLGALAFNRPPRAAPPPGPDPIEVPEEPAPAPSRPRPAMAALLAPLLLGGATALLWDPRLALFAALGPLAMVASWLEDRRRAGHAGRRSSAQLRAELARLAARLDDLRDDETTRRRLALPDPAAIVERATSATADLWERRPAHDDLLRLRLGTADVPWTPPRRDTGRPAAGAAEILADRSTLPGAPLDVDVRPGRVVGLVGEDREDVVAVLRSLVLQAGTLHGPADLRIAVVTDPDRVTDWAWARWLPHTLGVGEAAGVRLLAATEEDRAVVLGAVAAMADGPLRLLVADADGLTEGRPSAARSLLAGATGPVAGIVVARDRRRLPASCTTVVELDGDDGAATVFEPATNRRLGGVLLDGLPAPVSGAAARALAAIEDPEVADAGAFLPDRVGLLPLLGLEPTAAEVAARWGSGAPRLRAPIGVTEDGPLVVDLVADGPHGLIGGTTGSGKSELLRTLVAGLAASASPERLTFVLVDYKGGSAFDACARLPHVVGLVTDLDEHLGARALQCLEAELRFRETVLRDAGATDLPDDLARHRPTLPPRLVVVVDEFATLAAELPDFVDALVGIAQRGRSLGVHLLLATQRPAGAVKDNIRANTNLRIALRMQDAADSADVIDTKAAAAVGRRQAGRGYVRLGPSEVLPFQAAIVSQPTMTD